MAHGNRNAFSIMSEFGPNRPEMYTGETLTDEMRYRMMRGSHQAGTVENLLDDLERAMRTSGRIVPLYMERLTPEEIEQGGAAAIYERSHGVVGHYCDVCGRPAMFHFVYGEEALWGALHWLDLCAPHQSEIVTTVEDTAALAAEPCHCCGGDGCHYDRHWQQGGSPAFCHACTDGVRLPDRTYPSCRHSDKRKQS